MHWYKRWQSWREQHPFASTALTVLGLLITAPGYISDLKTWADVIQSISLPKDWERWLFVFAGLTIVFIANDIAGKLVKKFGKEAKTKLAPIIERNGLHFREFSYIDHPYNRISSKPH
jgi:hypothetical protein